MANFGCIPREILEKILQFLPLRDQINSGFVCVHWSEVVGCNINHVTIDASMPFGGRWLEENLRRMKYGSCYSKDIPEEFDDDGPGRYQDAGEWYRDKDDPADKEMRKLIPKLCKLSSKIKTLTIEDYHLDIESLTELLSSQTRIQAIRMINIKMLPRWAKNVYFEKIVESIIRNQETMEVIEIEIDTKYSQSERWELSFKSVKNIQSVIALKGRLCFPRLHSLKLGVEPYIAFKALSNTFLESLISSSQLKELEFPQCVDILPYIENGNLRLLKKFPVSTDNCYTRAVIENCPNITHGDEAHGTDLQKVISAYGPQLKVLDCSMNSSEIANAILEGCTNLESVKLILCPPPPDYNSFGAESMALKKLIPLFGYLEKLTEIDIWSKHFEIKAEIVSELIKKCGMKLQSLTLLLRGSKSHKILNTIGVNCKNLKKLRLSISNGMEDTERDTTKESSANKKLLESVDAILEGCQKLRTLYLNISGINDVRSEGLSWHKGARPTCTDVIYDQIGKKQPYLQNLELAQLRMYYPKQNFVKLVEAMPYCNIKDAHMNIPGRGRSNSLS